MNSPNRQAEVVSGKGGIMKAVKIGEQVAGWIALRIFVWASVLALSLLGGGGSSTASGADIERLHNELRAVWQTGSGYSYRIERSLAP